MIRLAVEAGGYAGLCMACPKDRDGEHDALYVVLVPYTMMRLCAEHLDELAIFIAEALGEP